MPSIQPTAQSPFTQMLEDLLDWNVGALHPMYLGPVIGLSNQVPTNNLQA